MLSVWIWYENKFICKIIDLIFCTLGVDKKNGKAGMMGRRGDCETGVTGWLGDKEIEWRGEKLSEITVVRCQL